METTKPANHSQPLKVPSGPEIVKLSLSYRVPTLAEEVSPLVQPKVKLFNLLNGMEMLYGETEVGQDQMEVDFATTFTLYYRFEVKQPLRLEVLTYKNQRYETIANITTALGEIIGTKDQAAVFRIASKTGIHGKLIVRAEKVMETNSTAFLEVSARKLNSQRGWLSTSSFYFVLAREVDGALIEVYRSDKIKKDLNPKWAPFNLPMETLCSNQTDAILQLNIYKQKYFGEKLFAQCSFTVDELMENKGKELVLSKPNKKKKYGILDISNFKLGNNATFADFLREDFQLSPILALDFALTKKSNSAYSDDDIALIHNFSDILIQNNSQRRVALYGLGGKPVQWLDPVRMFPFNGSMENSWISGLEKIQEKYYRVMKEKIIPEPVYFQPILEKGIQLAKESKAAGSKEYYVLIIFTKGSAHDLEDTFKTLVGCDLLPLSILFIGVGYKNFENMQIFQKEKFFLPEDKNKRGFVQFYPLKDFDDNIQSLIEEALKDVPNQFLKYMKMNDITVGPKKKMDIKKILATKKTFNMNDYGAGPRSILSNDMLEVKIFDNRRKSVGVFGRDDGFSSYVNPRRSVLEKN